MSDSEDILNEIRNIVSVLTQSEEQDREVGALERAVISGKTTEVYNGTIIKLMKFLLHHSITDEAQATLVNQIFKSVWEIKFGDEELRIVTEHAALSE